MSEQLSIQASCSNDENQNHSNANGVKLSNGRKKNNLINPPNSENSSLSLAECKVESLLYKNTYVHKIKDIVGQGAFGQILPSLCANRNQSNPQHQQQQNDQQLLSELPSEQTLNKSNPVDKKQRNKQSAKQSRQRKKMYIEILENKKKTLSKQLLRKKKQLEQTKDYLDRVVNQNKTISGFTAERHQLIKKLQILVSNKEDLSIQKRDTEINKIMDSLRYRIGATGKERVNTINEYFRQIVNLSLPALHRYMMWSASEENHLFSANEQQETDQWYKELRVSLNLSQEQLTEIKKKKTFLQDQKQILEQLIGNLKEVKGEIEEKSIELEDLIDKVREILTPVQCATFILFIEKNKYRKQLNLCEQLKGQNAQLSEGEDRGPRKLVKITECSQEQSH